MHLLTSLLVLIASARLLGEIFQRFNQPPIVGEMLAGIILGPSLLGLISANVELSGISDLAVFLIVLSAGLEMNFKDVVNVFRGKGIVIAVLGFVLPLTTGILVGTVFSLDAMRTIFLGLCVSITALPVAIRILQSFNLLESDIGRYSVTTAIFNDIAALLALGVILNLPDQPSIGRVALSIFLTAWKLVALGALILGFNWFLQRIVRHGVRIASLSERATKLLGNEALFGVMMLFVLVFASISESLGFHFVIGAFFGALLIDPSFFLFSRYNELQHTLKSVTDGFLAPVFFAFLGLEFDVKSLGSWEFVAAVVVISVVSKIVGGWLGGLSIGLSKGKSLAIGIILNGRGVMELVIASIAYNRGFIGQGLFSTLIFMGVVTTLITPLMLRKWGMPRLAAE